MNAGWLFIILLLLGSLFALTGVRQVWIQPLAVPISNFIWLGIQVLPLLALLPGLLTRRVNAYVYCALVSLLYLIHGVWLAATEALRTLGIIEALVAFALAVVASYGAKLLRDEEGLDAKT